ncbi:MAG TPA: hypothetical protein VFE57_12730, partial [Cyclobacteriaceae bacterium]|nr:hypothetical protein [Cyclobacteriaceae bacterium]
SSLSSQYPIDDVSIVEKDSGKYWINATLNPYLLDSLHKGNLKVYMTLDGKKDSLAVRNNNQGRYLFDYELPKNSHLGTMSIRTANTESYTKTFSLNADDIDLQFFPEGGELVHGFVSKVGFKALHYGGNGKMVEGVILDDSDHIITTFKSNELGMGVFFIKADSEAVYYARLTSPKKDRIKYPLPKVKSKGSLLSVEKIDKQFKIVVRSNYQKNDSVYLQISCRNNKPCWVKGKLKDGVLLAYLDTQSFQEGVITFTLTNSEKMPVAERLVFNERQEERLDIDISMDREIYSQRQKTAIQVSITESKGLGANADLSVLVVNKSEMGQLQSVRQNILSYFLMSSELKGEIENPGYYFRDENVNRLNDLDALLLTQGWRRIQYNQANHTLLFQPEVALNISGTVGGTFSKTNKKQGVELTMVTFGDPKSFASERTDSLGRFYFDVADTYGERMNFIIRSANRNGNKKDFQILLDRNISPEISYHQAPEPIDSVVSVLVEKQQERKLIDKTSGGTYLDGVNVKAKRFIPEREEMTEKYGEADVVIDGKAIQAKEEKWSYGLYSVLLFNFPKEIKISRVNNRVGSFLYASIYHRNPTLVVVDGVTAVAED